MYIMLRNLTVNIMAAFIPDRDRRHAFRNRYRRRSKFRKLRDDNRRLFNENAAIRAELDLLRRTTLMMFSASVVKPLEDTPKGSGTTSAYLSIVSVAKNEGPYLREWLEYHKIVGVDRFYFYDNGSTDNTREILEPYINDGTVVYRYVEGRYIQRLVYQDAIYRYRQHSRWMAFIDLDEFIVPTKSDSLPEVLRDYEMYPALVANWVHFDCGGHEKKPTANGGLVTANFTRARKDHNEDNGFHSDKGIKSIVNPAKVITYNIHCGFYYDNQRAVTEKFEPMVPAASMTGAHSSEIIRINHYHSKSKEEYLSKINRNQGFVSAPTTQFDDESLEFSVETYDDLVIQRFLPDLKKALGIKN